MFLNLLQALNDTFRKLSAREQRLALAVAALVSIFIVLMTVRGARDHLRGLDASIDSKQQDILNYTYLLAINQSVESQFRKVAMQHSSAWSEAEIQDRLRQEIYRLAQNEPPPLDENGIPVRTIGEGGNLVVPSLQPGNLLPGGEGYREFALNLQVMAVPFTSMMLFIERLQGSPQSLRIDALDLMRSPMENYVSADIDITRIIAEGVPAERENTRSQSSPDNLSFYRPASAADTIGNL